MSRFKKDRLQGQLLRQAQLASDDAIRADGHVSTEQMETLERLARLVQICDSVHPSLPRKRWPIAAILGSTLLIVSALLFIRVSETEIELDLALSEVEFVLPSQQVLTDVMALSALGVSGLREIYLPRARNQAARTISNSESSETAIHLSVASKEKRQGTVSLATLLLPAQTRVRLHNTKVPRQFRISLKGTGLLLRANAYGPVRIGVSGTPGKQIDFMSPKLILFRPGSEEVDLDLTLPDSSQGTFSSQLLASDLSLFRINKFMDLNHTMVHRVSTVLSGTLYFESLKGKKHLLRPGEALHFGDIHGEIRTLQIHDDHIILKFHGYVHRMNSGSGENTRSLMPTYMEWLTARHGLSLLWGTTLYLFGFIVIALRWWGIKL